MLATYIVEHFPPVLSIFHLGRLTPLDELRSALELATEEELNQLTNILFCRRFNPWDYFNTPEPMDVQSKSPEQHINAIEKDFAF